MLFLGCPQLAFDSEDINFVVAYLYTIFLGRINTNKQKWGVIDSPLLIKIPKDPLYFTNELIANLDEGTDSINNWNQFWSGEPLKFETINNKTEILEG